MGSMGTSLGVLAAGLVLSACAHNTVGSDGGLDAATNDGASSDGSSGGCGDAGVGGGWAKRFGGSGVLGLALGMATDDCNNVIMTGDFSGGAVDFGGGPIAATGWAAGFLAKFSSTGAHLWSRGYAGQHNVVGNSVAVDPDGNILVAGRFEDTVDFGGGPLTSAGGSDGFVAKLAPDGTHIWSKRFGGAGSDEGASVASSATGDLFLTGSFEGTVDFGGQTLTSAGMTDVFLAQYSASGSLAWAKRFGGAGGDRPGAVALDGSGGVVLCGGFSGTVDFGGAPLSSAGKIDIFLARYSPDGSHRSSVRWGGAGDDWGSAVAGDASGGVVIAGTFEQTVDFGGGPYTSAGGPDGFIARYSPAGAHQWSKRFGGSDAGNLFEGGNGVAVDRGGNVLCTGTIEGTTDFGGPPLMSPGGRVPFLAKLSPGGAHLWSHIYGVAMNGFGQGQACGFDGQGGAIAAGSVEDSADFGYGALPAIGPSDIFVLHQLP